MLICLILICHALYISNTAIYAEDPVSYYTNLFNKWGLHSDEYLIVKASDISLIDNTSNFSGYSKAVIVCDTQLILPDHAQCTYADVDIDSNPLNYTINLGSSINTSTTLYMVSSLYMNTQVLLIPESYLITPIYREKVENYIRNYSGKNSTVVINTDKLLGSNYKDILLSKNFGSFILVILSITFLYLFMYIIYSYYKSKAVITLTTKQFYKLMLKKTKDSVLKFRNINLLVLLLLTAATLFTILSKYGTNFSLAKVFPHGLSGFFSFTKINIVVLLYILIYCVSLLLYFFSYPYKCIYEKVTNISGNTGPLKYIRLVFLLPFAVLAVISSYQTSNIATVLIPITLLYIIGIMFHIKLAHYTIAKAFSLKQKCMVLIYFFCIFVVNVVTHLSSITPLNNKPKELVESTEGILPLPKNLNITPTTIFSDYYISPSSRVFINSKLVFDPMYEIINNTPINNFNPKGMFIITVKSDQEFRDNLVKYPEILNYIKNSEPSRYFLLSSNFAKSKPGLVLTLTFDCTKSLTHSDINLSVYSPLSKEASDFVETTRVMNFPGCTEEFSDKTYSVPLILDDQEGLPTLYEIYNFSHIGIKNIKLTANGNPVLIEFLKDPVTNPILYSSTYASEKSNNLTVYPIGLTKPQQFIRTSNTVNLSGYINQLIKEHIITDALTIWSDSSYLYLEKTEQEVN